MAKGLRVVLNVADFDAVVAFYSFVLRLAVSGGWDRGPTDQGALIEVAPGAVVEIVGHGPSFATPDYGDAAIAIEYANPAEVDEQYGRLRELGLPVDAPKHRSWSHYSMNIRDPVGVEVVVFAEDSPSKPNPATAPT